MSKQPLDLKTRLRQVYGTKVVALHIEAADRIDALEAERNALQATLAAMEAVEPVPPSDENITDAWVSASDSDGIAYDGPSFERGYRLGRGEYDEHTGSLVAAARAEAHGIGGLTGKEVEDEWQRLNGGAL